MNRDDLVALARRHRIRPDSYSFDPDAPGEHYVLTGDRGEWRVYFSQHGRARNVERFTTEDAACRRLLAQLQADLSTKVSRARADAPTSRRATARRTARPPEQVSTWQLVAAVLVLVALAWGWAATHQDGGSPTTPTPAVSGR